jgi:hypothetical protein
VCNWYDRCEEGLIKAVVSRVVSRLRFVVMKICHAIRYDVGVVS